MTVDTTERIQLEAAYRALYLLPSAPRELVDAAYAALARDRDGAKDVQRAYEAIAAAPDMPEAYILPQRTSPWELLHLCPDAPDAVAAAAYDLWRGDAEPIVVRAPVIERLPKADASVARIKETSESFLYAFEELHDLPSASSFTVPVGAPASVQVTEPLLDGTEEIEQLEIQAAPIEEFTYAYEELPAEPLLDETEEIEQQRREAFVYTREAFVYTCEEFASEAMAAPSEALEAEEETSAPLAGPMLVGAEDVKIVLTDRPLRIGTQPSCDVVVQADARVEARVWRNKGRVLVHALGEPGLVLVNGQAATWGVLSDGDMLAVGPAAFEFRA